MYNDSVLYLFRIVNRETIQRLFQAHTDQFKNPILSKRNYYDIKATRLRRKGNAITT